MGCAVGTGNTGHLRDARQQVAELQRKLEEAERERVSLREQVEALEQQRSGGDAPAALPASASGGPRPGTAGSGSGPPQGLAAAAALPPELPARQGEGEAAQEAAVAAAGASSRSATPPEHARGAEPEPGAPEEPPSLLHLSSAGSASPGVGTGARVGLAGCGGNEEPDDYALPGRLPPYAEEQVESCLSPDSTSVINSGHLSETEVMDVSPKACLRTPCPDAPSKLTHSMDSSASTCTPGSQKLRDFSRCHQCSCEGLELFQDPSDLNHYCERCWTDFYGSQPQRYEVQPLVPVEVFELWQDAQLAQLWAGQTLPGWPPPLAHQPPAPPIGTEGELWSSVSVRVRRDIVGPHAREQTGGDTLYPGEILAGKYRVQSLVGQGHFTKAFLAEDLTNGGMVCLKRHRQLTVEALSDLMVIGHRMAEVDAGGVLFPRLIDAFYDMVCFTVESLLEGQNCLALAQANPAFFADLGNLRQVAKGVLLGLSHLDRAGVVHNDVKPDNLMWVEAQPPNPGDEHPSAMVRIVDFGCARLDQREEPGRNWSLAEGGAGHLGKWSPEMALRLPITHQGDVWGLAISLCELHCGRAVWRSEADTAEVVLAQALGLCDLRDGLPSSLLRRSPLDIRQLYTPAPRHFPLRRNALGQLEALCPARWGLEQVLGENWRETGKGELKGLLQHALVVDPAIRPSAAQLVECCRFVKPERVSPRSPR